MQGSYDPGLEMALVLLSATLSGVNVRKKIEKWKLPEEFYRDGNVAISELVKSKVYMQKSIFEMVNFTKALGGKEETVYGLSGLGDLYVSSAGGRNSKMGKYLGDGYVYSKAKSKFMPNETVEGAELAFEIGPKILKDVNKKKFPLMYSLVDSLYNDKKLEIKW